MKMSLVCNLLAEIAATSPMPRLITEYFQCTWPSIQRKPEAQIIRTLDGAVHPTHMKSADVAAGQQGQGDRHDFDGETGTLR